MIKENADQKPGDLYRRLWICLVAGLLLTCLNAWVACYFRPLAVTQTKPSNRLVTFQKQNINDWPWRMHQGKPSYKIRMTRSGFGRDLCVLSGSFQNDSFQDQNDPTVTYYPHHEVAQVEAGWPFKAFTGDVHLSHAGKVTVVSTKTCYLRSSQAQVVEYMFLLPYGPIWTGLLFNTLFYGAIVWGVMHLVSILGVQGYRRRNGLCLNCGYDLKGSPDATACPECGHAIANA